MSSAILYVAIVAIWAVVLIPRWLRRDSSAAAPTAAPAPVSDEVQAEEVAVAESPEPAPAPAPAPRRRAERAETVASRRAVPDEGREYRRVMTARRRLLGLLIALTVGSVVLAYAKMAAWWVIMPPIVMLFGYLLLLREASRADADRRSAERARVRGSRVREASRPAEPVPVAEAEVFTFSAPREELYDQYADAKLRAVGD